MQDDNSISIKSSTHSRSVVPLLSRSGFIFWVSSQCGAVSNVVAAGRSMARPGAIRPGSICLAGQNNGSRPITLVQAGSKWFAGLLEEITGRKTACRGVVVYPGRFEEPRGSEWRSHALPWVLELKARGAFIAHESPKYSEADVKGAAASLSRYVRTTRVTHRPEAVGPT
jgi:hypothetical protein